MSVGSSRSKRSAARITPVTWIFRCYPIVRSTGSRRTWTRDLGDAGLIRRSLRCLWPKWRRSLSVVADLVILNKFGKQEAEGRGFREALAGAVAEGIPVLVGLNALNKAAFETFAAGLPTECPPTLEALTQ